MTQHPVGTTPRGCPGQAQGACPYVSYRTGTGACPYAKIYSSHQSTIDSTPTDIAFEINTMDATTSGC